jgi:hypothetical protein
MNKDCKKALIVCWLWLFSLVIGIDVPVQAQGESESQQSVTRLQVTPPAVRFELNPGASASGSFKVTNDGTLPFTYSIYVSPYSPINEQYEISFTQETARNQITRWLTFSQEQGSLTSRQSDEITFTINVPVDVPAGGQYATIFIETGGNPATNNVGVLVKQRIGVIVYARILGNTRDEGELERAWIPSFQWYLPVTTSSLIANAGNTDFTVNYTATARGFFGGLVRAEKQYAVLPETKREVTLEIADLAPLGLYFVTQELDFLEQNYSQTKWVWVIHPMIAISILGLLALVFGAIAVYHFGPTMLKKIKVKKYAQKR